MYECPVGWVLRNHPATYELIDLANAFSSAGPIEISRMPRYVQQAARFVHSEKERLRELDRKRKQPELDLDYARKIARGRSA